MINGIRSLATSQGFGLKVSDRPHSQSWKPTMAPTCSSSTDRMTLTRFHVTKADTRNRLFRVKHSIGDLLRRTNLSLAELDLIASELKSLLAQAQEQAAR